MTNLLHIQRNQMKKQFDNNLTYLPITMQQFEDLTNEILKPINELAAPNFLSADYAAQILMSAIHALDHKEGRIEKSALFESCVNRISCHVTYHAVDEIQKRLKVEMDKDKSVVTGQPEGMAIEGTPETNVSEASQ